MSRVDPDRLIDFATAVYAGAGMPDADAKLVADTLVRRIVGTSPMRAGSVYLDRIRKGN